MAFLLCVRTEHGFLTTRLVNVDNEKSTGLSMEGVGDFIKEKDSLIPKSKYSIKANKQINK
jgi:hypothetical protein